MSEEAFLNDLMDSKEGQDASDLLAVRTAIELGIAPLDAIKYLVSDPVLKTVLILESISKQGFV